MDATPSGDGDGDGDADAEGRGAALGDSVGGERRWSRSERRARGVFYTPPAVVAQVVAETFAPILRARLRPGAPLPALRILDPACGDGRFLAAALGHLVAAAAAAGHDAEAARAHFAAGLVGVDRDPQAVVASGLALPPAATLHVGEALGAAVLAKAGFDAIVGNPPYVRSIRLKSHDPLLWAALRGRYAATSQGEWDLYAAFLEACVGWLAPGGEAGLVVPSRWLTARTAAPLRALLAERGCVRRIVDFGARQVLGGPTTYTALVFLSATAQAKVLVERPDGPGEVRTCVLGAGPWVLTSRTAARRLERLRRAGPRLGEVAHIRKGAGSNADPIFLVPTGSAIGRGESTRVPCVRGRDVLPYGIAPAMDALLPYLGGRLRPAEELATQAPSTWAHLEAHRAKLEARERGRFRGAAAHAWGRPQNLAWLLDPAPKIIVPDAARAGRAALDDHGRLVIDTAYALRPIDARATPIGLLLAVLNAEVVAEWLGQAGVPLRGGYFRMKTAYLAELPIPDPTTPGARAVAAEALAMATAAVSPAATAALSARVMALYQRDA